MQFLKQLGSQFFLVEVKLLHLQAVLLENEVFQERLNEGGQSHAFLFRLKVQIINSPQKIVLLLHQHLDLKIDYVRNELGRGSLLDIGERVSK